MKRYGNLWPQITRFDNILLAARKAQKGKRYRPNVLAFNYNLEQELNQLQHQLQTKNYQPGPYRTFRISYPKPRTISAAPYRDRVVHHALCNIIWPIFERSLIFDTYANRWGFGTHRALHRFTQFARSSPYILQCDIRKYFPSIDHEILKTLLRRKIKCPDTLWLIDTIIDGSNDQEPVIVHFPGDTLLTPLERRRGLPIGNLTSQCFANIYLSGFDHFVKEQLGFKKYLRYVDDFALFADDRKSLIQARTAIEDYLATLRLTIHPIKSQLYKTAIGANFVGFRVFKEHIRVRGENLHRARRRLRQLQHQYKTDAITFQYLTQSIQSWGAHLKHADSHRLRDDIFTTLVFTK
ncbi:MAG: RNA-directed DNA polymerase [Leptolyngbyaceae cyanobacterium]